MCANPELRSCSNCFLSCCALKHMSAQEMEKAGRSSKLPLVVQPNWGGTAWEQFSAPDADADCFPDSVSAFEKLYQNQCAWLPSQGNQCFSLKLPPL